MPRRLLTIKAAAAVLVAAMTIGGVAAAAGVFPGPAQPAVDNGRGSPGRGPANPGGGDATTTTAAGKPERGGTATGPDATGPARDGLCRAWRSGQGEEHGKREDSTAFRALAAAAGGADKIAAYCQATTSGGSKEKGHGEGQGAGEGQGHDRGQRQGDGHGKGEGRG